MLILTIAFVCAGLVCAGIGFLLMCRKIGPNPWWGFRVPQTQADPRFWYQLHAYFGKWLAVTGACVSLAAWGLYALAQVGFETQRWFHVIKGDGTVEYVQIMVPLGITELCIFCLPLLAGCSLVLAILTWPALFWRTKGLSQRRPSPVMAEQQSPPVRDKKLAA